MPEWLDIIIKILTFAIAIFGFIGIGAYFSEKWKHRAKNDISEKEKIEQAIEEQFKESVREIVREEVSSIKADVAEIKNTCEKQIKADILNERCNMKVIHDRCKLQGFSDIGDKVTMKELYNNYKDNGGNEFRAFVDKWFEDVQSLPDELK